MAAESFPPIRELVPHAGGMCLLDEVLEHDPRRTRCRVDPRDSALLADPDGSVPVWVGIEYMAQCVAVHGGLAARARGEAPRPGLFLGSRRLRFAVPSLPAGPLTAEARHHRGERGLVAFDCCVRADSDAAPLVEGRLNVYLVDRWEDLLEEAMHGA